MYSNSNFCKHSIHSIKLLCYTLLLALTAPAHGGNGPWTLGDGDISMYGEAQYQQWQRAAGATGEAMSIGNRVLLTRLNAGFSYGLLPGVEIEGKLGLAISTTSDPSLGLCAEFSCKSLTGVLPIEAKLKWQILDEISGPPISLAIAATTRMGAHTAGDRHRITSYGEGTTDFGGLLSIGRAGGLGSIGYAIWADIQYRHRVPVGIPLAPDATGSEIGAIPADEIVLITDWMLLVTNQISIGPTLDFLYRIDGTTLAEMSPLQRDSIASLQAKVLKVGAKAGIRSSTNTAINIAFLYTVYARNNPSDLFLLSVGVSGFKPKNKAHDASSAQGPKTDG